MSIANIVDHRKREYRFARVNAVIEATWHDNRCDDADQSPKPEDDGPAYDEKEHISIAEAIAWAQSFSTPVTLYLYDENSGIYLIHPMETTEE